jgi:hypothetical protein
MSRRGKTLSLMLLIFVALAFTGVVSQSAFAKKRYYYTQKFVKPKKQDASDYMKRYYPNGYNPSPYYYQPIVNYSYATGDGYYMQSCTGNCYKKRHKHRYKNNSTSLNQNPYFNRSRSNPYFRR